MKKRSRRERQGSAALSELCLCRKDTKESQKKKSIKRRREERKRKGKREHAKERNKAKEIKGDRMKQEGINYGESE